MTPDTRVADANPAPDPLVNEIAKLNAIERRIIERFVQRRVRAQDTGDPSLSRGDRLADHVTAFGGSWPFIFLTIAGIGGWMVINATMAKLTSGGRRPTTPPE